MRSVISFSLSTLSLLFAISCAPGARADDNTAAGQPQPSDSRSKSRILAPIRLLENYVSVGYNPSIEFDKQGLWVTTDPSTGAVTGNFGSGHTTIRNGREMSFWIAGPAGKHLSFWLEDHPTRLVHGFLTKWETLAGNLNFGDNKQFVQIRGGQFHTFQEGGGWSLADRTVTATTPLIYSDFNGFNPDQVVKGGSLEYTLPGWTTSKAFVFCNEADQNGNIDQQLKFERSRGLGLIFEKKMSKTTMSGVQIQSAIGWTPTAVNYPSQYYNFASAADYSAQLAGWQIDDANALANGTDEPTPPTQPTPYTANQINMTTNKFQRLFVVGNKAFNDQKGFERVNGSFGFMLGHDSRNYSLTDPNTGLLGQKSIAYGFTTELLTIPIVRHLAVVTRYDQFRPNSHQHDNTQFVYTIGLALDGAGPNKPRQFAEKMRHWERIHGKFTFDYQIVGQHGQKPFNRYILTWWPVI